MVQRGLGDEQIGDGGAMPHAVVVREICLEPQRPVQDVRRSDDGAERRAETGLQRIVIVGRARGIQLLQLTDGADEEPTGEVGQLGRDARMQRMDGGALIEHPACGSGGSAFRHRRDRITATCLPRRGPEGPRAR